MICDLDNANKGNLELKCFATKPHNPNLGGKRERAWMMMGYI